MNPGRLDKYVSLQRLDSTLDAMGGVVETWSHVAFVWGQWISSVGREFVSAQARVSEASGVLRIRYRSDIDETWRVVIAGRVFEVAAPPEEPAVSVGPRGSLLDLVLKQARAGANQFPLTNIFSVPLKAGSDVQAVKFPQSFDGVPQGLYVQLVVPSGQGSFTISPRDITATDFTVDLGAEVPVPGYKLSVQAFRYNQTFTIDLEEGAASQIVIFTTAFPSVPRGLKATLQPPLPDGYEFTTALVVKSLTAESFTLEFGATVPGPNYKALIQVSL